MWEPQPLATLRASTASTGITLPYPTDLSLLLLFVHYVIILFGKNILHGRFKINSIKVCHVYIDLLVVLLSIVQVCL
jgi:hypothetical protein